MEVVQIQDKQRMEEHNKTQMNTRAGRQRLMAAAAVQDSAGSNAALQFPGTEEDGHPTSVTLTNTLALISE